MRGGARNFGLGGPSCDANILVKTNLYTHTHTHTHTHTQINLLREFIILNFNEYIKVMYFFY